MANGQFSLPYPINEPVLDYAPGSPERKALKAALSSLTSDPVEIPAIIGGKPVRTGRTIDVTSPHDHSLVLAKVHLAGPKEVKLAIKAAAKAWKSWSELPWESRAAVFLKAADLLAGPWRMRLNGATMVNQSKTAIQAEIDSACELVDFWRFNTWYAEQMYAQQPRSSPGVWNYVEHRALEGFIFAVTPFNFTAIAGNLPTAPAMLGNTVLWKPATTAIYSGYLLYQLLEEAGLPPGVINFLPGHGPDVGDPALASPDLAGIHFTGSTPVFQGMWNKVGSSIANYKSYPRLVGETGGKDFVFAHPSSDVEALATALVRGAFEYQGQKCSAASRAYIPKSLWKATLARVKELMETIRVGSPLDFRNFMGAVIDEKSFNKLSAAIDVAKKDRNYKVVAGGTYDRKKGWFVQPTVIVSKDPKARFMSEELFGPILTVYVYEDAKLRETLRLCDTTGVYALTGAIFGQDRTALVQMSKALRHSAGNFYINDKPTGAVVGQQPFGGARASGTNDKAGSMLNLQRWTSQRSVKETFVPSKSIDYPHMGGK